jgi:hypothetical protein
VTVSGITGTLTNGLHDGDYSGVTSITGGSDADQLVVEDGATITPSFDGGAGTDSVINRTQYGTTAVLTTSHVETFIDRPLLYIHGFGGSFAADTSPAGLEEYFLNRGIAPDKLASEPFSDSDKDLVQTIVNVGYVNGTNQPSVTGTFFSALWDYRTPVAVTDDGVRDGLLSDVTAASLQDSTFDSALDYLAHWLNEATVDWQSLTGSVPASVDMITHSTGGVVSRAYIQSAAYGAAANLPKVNQLVQVGVPSQGTGQTFAMINNDFSLKSTARAGGMIVNFAWELLNSGKTITNPDGTTITNASLPAEDDFPLMYVETLRSLLPSYAFYDDVPDANEVFGLFEPDDGGNNILFDLNAVSTDDFVTVAHPRSCGQATGF